MASIFRKSLSYSVFVLGVSFITFPASVNAKTKIAKKPLTRPYTKTITSAPKTGPFPCDGGFELKISIKATTVAEPTPVGVHLEIPEKGRGIASHVHSERSSGFSQKACEIWQRTTWPRLQAILFSNTDPQRKKVVCTNVGVVEYKLGSKQEKAKICLNSPRTDALSSSFKGFYEGTELLVAR